MEVGKELGGNIESRDLETIYSGELDLKEIMKNPILKPVAEINKSYENLEQLIYFATYEYQEKYKKIKEMIDENPKYGETMLVTIIINMIEYIKQIIKSQDIQKQNMKDAINEMIKINGEQYAQLSEEEQKEPPIKSTEPEDEEGKEIQSSDEITQEETPEESREESSEETEEKTEDSKEGSSKDEKKYHSDLLGKELPIPKNIQNKSEEEK